VSIPDETAPSGPDGGLFTLPNLVTLVRLGCVPVFLWLLIGRDDHLAAAILLAFLGATDWVDGYLARRLGQVSEVGKILDPTADRIMLLVAVLAIASVGSVPWWFAGLTLAREGAVSVIAIVLGALGARRIDVTWWGKTGTFLLMFSYPLFLSSSADWPLADAAWWLAWACGLPGLAISYYAAWGYVPTARRALAEGRAARRSPAA
jgi:cardiolipin synthase (CMP-forming)